MIKMVYTDLFQAEICFTLPIKQADGALYILDQFTVW